MAKRVPHADLPYWGRLLQRPQAAGYLSIGESLFDEMVKAGKMPPPKQLSPGRLAWDRHALDRYIDELPEKETPRQSNPLDRLLNG